MQPQPGPCELRRRVDGLAASSEFDVKSGTEIFYKVRSPSPRGTAPVRPTAAQRETSCSAFYSLYASRFAFRGSKRDRTAIFNRPYIRVSRIHHGRQQQLGRVLKGRRWTSFELHSIIIIQPTSIFKNSKNFKNFKNFTLKPSSQPRHQQLPHFTLPSP